MALPVKTIELEETIDLSLEYTAEEFIALPDDGNHYELIKGKLVMNPAPNNEHGAISDELLTTLRNFLQANPGIGKVWSHTGFNIGKKANGKDNVPEPDLGFIVAARLPAPDYIGYLPFPDLAVEVWSRTSDLDRPGRIRTARAKLQMYLNAGARLAWGINPIKQEIEVYHPGQLRTVLHYLKAFGDVNIGQNKLGRAYVGASCNLGRTTGKNFPKPDVCFVLKGRTPDDFEGPIPVAPDLVVEVNSPSDTEERRFDKLQAYQQAEVPLIWSIHMLEKYVLVYRKDEPYPQLFTLRDELDGGTVLPGLKIKVSTLFQ